MNETRRRAPWFLKLHSLAAYLFLYAPIIVLVIFSFNQDRRNAVWKGFTTEWYFALLHDDKVIRALRYSLEIAFLATLISATLGTMAALALSRYRFRGRSAVSMLIYLPMMVPEIVMGIGLLSFFVMIGLQLSIWTVMFAHVAFSVGYVTVTVRTRLAGIDSSLEEAAADLGADPWTTFRLVTFPRILPGVVSGALLAFTLSLDDFVITYFTAGGIVQTLPLKIYAMLKFGVTPEINAISTLMLGFTLGLMAIWSRLENSGQGN